METVGITLASSTPTTVTCSSTQHTKGSYASLGTASAAFSAIRLYLRGASAQSKMLVDCRIGGATTVLGDFAWSPINNTEAAQIIIPYGGSSSDAIEVRAQSSFSGGTTLEAWAELYTSDEWQQTSGTVADNYGASTGSSAGTTVNPGGSANTKGAWAEVASSLSNDVDWLVLSVSGAADVIRSNTGYYMIDIGTGAASSEVARVNNLTAYGSSVTDSWSPISFTIPVDRAVFASGTRVAVRAQSSVTSDNTFEVTLHGYQVTAGGGGGGGLASRLIGGSLIG